MTTGSSPWVRGVANVHLWSAHGEGTVVSDVITLSSVALDCPDARTLAAFYADIAIAETACLAGHLDTARELLDGRIWRVVTG